MVLVPLDTPRGPSATAASPERKSSPQLWNAVGSARRASSVTEDRLSPIRAINAAEKAESMRKDGSVVLEMEEVDPSVPFYRQGNMAVSTVEAYKERFMLKASPRVRDALHSWWLMAPRVKRTMPPFGFPVEVLMQDGYSSVMRAAYRVLCEDSSWDDPELDAQIAHDWEVDADGKVLGSTVGGWPMGGRRATKLVGIDHLVPILRCGQLQGN